MSDFKEIDQELLNGYLQTLGKDVLAKMLELYIRQSTAYIETIQQAIESEAQGHWTDACHKMKGAAGSVGLIEVHAQLAALEKSTLDWQGKSTAFHKMQLKNKQSIEQFKCWLAQ